MERFDEDNKPHVAIELAEQLAINRVAMSEIIQQGRTGKSVEDFEEGYHVFQECLDMNRAHIAARARRKFNYKKMTRQYLYAYGAVLYRYGLNRVYGGVCDPAFGLSMLQRETTAP